MNGRIVGTLIIDTSLENRSTFNLKDEVVRLFNIYANDKKSI